MVDEPSKDHLSPYGSLQCFFAVFRFLSVLLVLTSIPSVLSLAQLGAELPPAVSHIALDERTGNFLPSGPTAPCMGTSQQQTGKDIVNCMRGQTLQALV